MQHLELREGLDGLARARQHPQHVESHSLGERSALANNDLVTFLDTECGRDVGGEVLVALLVSGVLGDVVEVFAADDDGSVHLGGLCIAFVSLWAVAVFVALPNLRRPCPSGYGHGWRRDR